MKRELVLVHGRSQHDKDAGSLKAEWLDALRAGLKKSGLELEIKESNVHFAYYGDTLRDMVKDVRDADVAEVIIRGRPGDTQMNEFIHSVLKEVVSQKDIKDEEIMTAAERAVAARGESVEVIERGPLNWGWVQGILSAIDRHVPLASGAALALATRDVYLYLKNPRIQDKLEKGISKAMKPGVQTVVVSHSLGTVVSYNLLRRKGLAEGWKVPLFVTLGSPLAVSKIRAEIGHLEHPDCVGKWFNAMDPDDVVSLFPLDKDHFNIEPSIENKIDVDNWTTNQHGIVGYLDDAEVARRIHEALVA